MSNENLDFVSTKTKKTALSSFRQCYNNPQQNLLKEELAALTIDHGEPLAVTTGVIGGGHLCHVPTWVEHAKNNTVLEKIELTFRKFQFLL